MKITLCGSLKFENEFKKYARLLTLSGHIVHSVACFPSDNGSKDWYTTDEKCMLDVMHLAKIDQSEAIFVLDIGFYIGESTRREILYAEYTGKTIIYHSRDHAWLIRPEDRKWI